MTRPDAVDKKWIELAISGIDHLNEIVQAELAKRAPDPNRIYEYLLTIVEKIIGADTCDIRLVDENSQQLYFRFVRGDAWDAGTPAEREARRAKRFPLRQKSAGALVYRTGRPYLIDDVTKDALYSAIFPETRRLLVAPIVAQNRVIGVMDIRSSDESPFPPYATEVAQMLGRQLGLYFELIQTITELREAEEGQRKARERQANSFRDLQHQLRSPIFGAHHRLERALSETRCQHRLHGALLAVRGQIARAGRVTYSIRLFEDLVNERPITIARDVIPIDVFLRHLKQAASDCEVIVSDHGIKCRVDERSFRHSMTALIGDSALLEHAISSLLDNAGKYSFPNTTVSVVAGWTRSDRFYISVQNMGIRIHPNEAAKCVVREWQSEGALAVSGTGSGIGLWLADNIMRAHGGEVEVRPTRNDGITEIRLLFPSTSVRRHV